MTTTVEADYFETLHAARPDPFGLRGSWYEQRKREVLLAALPRRAYRDAWEVGCSNGELSAALAPRCERLLATDASAHAVAHAEARTRDLPQVRVRQAQHPRDWPSGTFDLIVFSEIGYYLDVATLEETIRRFAGSLVPDGTFVACHWRHAFAPAPLDGDRVHARLDANLPWPRIFRYVDADFVLDGWSGRRDSIAQQEGKR
ncbi:MAG TPA: SAM-dependent methyltransferase [Dokdonella sp.]